MEEITLVTAFFDIGRKNFDNYARSNEQYLDYFKVWARMKNNLIVYTNKQMGEKVKEVRKEYGLLDKTIIIEIENENSIEPDILKKMNDISEDDDFRNLRFYKNAVSNGYKYDYVMLLKYWCLADAVKRKIAKGMIAWIDFGFNHGDKCYIKPEEFDFLWKTNLDNSKIHLFALKEIDNRPAFVSVMTLKDCIMGCLLVLPDFLCVELWNLVKKSMNALLTLGVIDDDQLLLLMSYREKSEIFEIHISDWFLPLKENGAEHLSVREKKYEADVGIIGSLKKIKRKINSKIYNNKEKNIYLKQIQEIIYKE